MMQVCKQGLGCQTLFCWQRAVFCPVLLLRVLVACSATALARPLRWEC